MIGPLGRLVRVSSICKEMWDFDWAGVVGWRVEHLVPQLKGVGTSEEVVRGEKLLCF